ncbi:MAG TPA: hypothetical protein VG798_07285, partial [Rhizomicrobium sp.]|nr:hypothetical protein [Rhizomicrobium sp.]
NLMGPISTTLAAGFDPGRRAQRNFIARRFAPAHASKQDGCDLKTSGFPRLFLEPESLNLVFCLP